MALKVMDGRDGKVDFRPRAARFLAMPVIYSVLLMLALLVAEAVEPSRVLAQGTYGVGGYLVRPEQDIVNDPSSIDPNATYNGRELRKRKREEAQPETQQRNRVQQEKTNRHQRPQERAEEAPRNRHTRPGRPHNARAVEPETATGGADDVQPPLPERREAVQPAPREAGQEAAGAGVQQGAGEEAAAEKAATEKAEAEKVAAEKAAAEKAEAEKVAAEKAVAEKAAAELAAKLQTEGRDTAAGAAGVHDGTKNTGDLTAVIANAGDALVNAGALVLKGDGVSKSATDILAAADTTAQFTAVLQSGGKAGTEIAAPPLAATAPPAEAGTATATTANTQSEAATGADNADPLDKMIGQLLMVGFEGTTPDEPSVQKLAAQIKSGQVGGVLFLGRNIVSPQQVTTLNAYLRRANPDVPVLLAIDQEGGVVQRLSHDKGFPEFPSAGQVGQSNDPLNAYAVYERMAGQLAEYGFNFNLGPVVDLQRGKSAVIAGQERSFGDRPRHVAAFAKAFCIAHRSAGLLTALKHFPGHGSAGGDTHNGDVDVSESWKADELDPYRELIGAGAVDVVMTGHIAHRNWSDEAGLPASLSEKAIAKMLRGDLGFSGVIITDDLEMGAVSKRYTPEASVVRAIKAGNTIVMLSNKAHPSLDLPERMIAAIRKAVQDGELTRAQVEQSYELVMALKQRLRTHGSKVSVKHDAAAGAGSPAQ